MDEYLIPRCRSCAKGYNGLGEFCWACWNTFKVADRRASDAAGIRQDMVAANIWLKPGAGKSTPGYRAAFRKTNHKVVDLVCKLSQYCS